MSLFRIKTKKDKQIEQLKREVEWLKAQKIDPIVIANSIYNRFIKSLYVNFTVPNELEGELSQDHINQILSIEIANKVPDYLDIVCNRDYMKNTITYVARIDILLKGNRYD